MCCNAFKPLNPHDPSCFFSFSRPVLPLRRTGLGCERQRTFARTSRSCTEGIEGIVSLVGWGSRFRRSNGLAFFFLGFLKKYAKMQAWLFQNTTWERRKSLHGKKDSFSFEKYFGFVELALLCSRRFVFLSGSRKKDQVPGTRHGINHDIDTPLFFYNSNRL